jgi:hypothetical protein
VLALKRLNNNNNERITTMKKTLTTNEIADALAGDEYGNFTRAGAWAMAEFLDENMPDDAEFDAVAIRCDWSEYKSLFDWADDFFRDHEDAAEKLGLTFMRSRSKMGLSFFNNVEEDYDSIEAAIRHYIAEKAEPAIEFDGGVIVPCF